MAFFNSAVGVLQTLVIALGAGLGIWGVINLMEGYGNDNPGAKSQGMKRSIWETRTGSSLNGSGWWNPAFPQRTSLRRHHSPSPAEGISGWEICMEP